MDALEYALIFLWIVDMPSFHGGVLNLSESSNVANEDLHSSWYWKIMRFFSAVEDYSWRQLRWAYCAVGFSTERCAGRARRTWLQRRRSSIPSALMMQVNQSGISIGCCTYTYLENFPRIRSRLNRRRSKREIVHWFFWMFRDLNVWHIFASLQHSEMLVNRKVLIFVNMHCIL